jgi:hypothetical protein
MIAAAELTAAPFDFETFGVSAAVAAGAGAAVGAAAAAGILAAVIPAFIAAHKQQPSATVLTSAQANQSLSVLKTALPKNPSLQPVVDMTQLAIKEGRPLYSVYDGTSTTLVSQLSMANLATAAANYNVNPDLFKGTPKVQLQAMGLNPALTDGKLPTTNADNNIDSINTLAKQVFGTQTPTTNQINQTANMFYQSSISSVFDSSVSTVPNKTLINSIKPLTTPLILPTPTTPPIVPLTPEEKALQSVIGGIANIVKTVATAPGTAPPTTTSTTTSTSTNSSSNSQ